MLGLSVHERTGNREIMGKLQYPEAHRDDTVDVYDGTKVRKKKTLIYLSSAQSTRFYSIR